jgi:energy-coupling factor transporter transmembrane protein EcfT
VQESESAAGSTQRNNPRAAALALFAAGVALFGPHSPNHIVGVTLAAVVLSFVPEMIWRKYL